jgi:hypothetical protein
MDSILGSTYIKCPVDEVNISFSRNSAISNSGVERHVSPVVVMRVNWYLRRETVNVQA